MEKHKNWLGPTWLFTRSPQEVPKKIGADMVTQSGVDLHQEPVLAVAYIDSRLPAHNFCFVTPRRVVVRKLSGLQQNLFKDLTGVERDLLGNVRLLAPGNATTVFESAPFLPPKVLLDVVFKLINETWSAHRVADERNCPYCAETVKRAAKICKHCGKELPEIVVESQPSVVHGQQPAASSPAASSQQPAASSQQPSSQQPAASTPSSQHAQQPARPAASTPRSSIPPWLVILGIFGLLGAIISGFDSHRPESRPRSADVPATPASQQESRFLPITPRQACHALPMWPPVQDWYTGNNGEGWSCKTKISDDLVVMYAYSPMNDREHVAGIELLSPLFEVSSRKKALKELASVADDLFRGLNFAVPPDLQLVITTSRGKTWVLPYGTVEFSVNEKGGSLIIRAPDASQ